MTFNKPELQTKSKTRFFSLVVILLLAFSVQSQNISYKTLEDDPYNIKRLMLHIDPFYADCWWTDITCGWGLRADLHYGSLGTLNVDFRHAYLDVNQNGNKGNKEIKKHTWFEGVAAINFIDRTKQRSIKVVLSSSSHTSGGYTYTNSRFFMAPGTKRKITSIRGGMYYANTAYGTDDAGAYKVEGVDTLRPLIGEQAMMKTMTVVGGISFKSIVNLQVAIDDWGGRRVATYSDVFIDVLYAPAVGLGKGTVENINPPYLQTANADLDVTEKKHIGWRMGFYYKNPVKSFLSYKFEFGTRPGYKSLEKGILSHNSFLMLTFGWSIPFNVRF